MSKPNNYISWTKIASASKDQNLKLIFLSQNEQWPDLFQFLRSNAPRAAYTMSVLAEMAGESVIPNLSHFIEIFRSALQNSTADPESAYYTTITLTHLVSFIDLFNASFSMPPNFI